ncbi:MAG: membrane integrity-associated transporter subunit PqiC [Candidatus Methylomirabilales bacterium]
MRRLVLPLVVVTLGASMLGGCVGGKSKPSSFYVLSPLPDAKAGKQVAAGERDVAIGIGPIDLPHYLDRTQIVIRASPNQLDFAEFDRWAEPLRDNFSRTLTENLSTLLATPHVAVFPWDGSTPIDYQVEVEVTRFEGDADGNALLIARWSIFGKGVRELLVRRRSRFSKAAGAQDYEALVSAMSRALANLSREIATAIETVSQ